MNVDELSANTREQKWFRAIRDELRKLNETLEGLAVTIAALPKSVPAPLLKRETRKKKGGKTNASASKDS